MSPPGETQPVGESLHARLLVIEVGAGDIDQERLSACQQDAARGLYAQATAGYIAWLASRLDEVRKAMDVTGPEYRMRFERAGLHHRTPGMVADLMIGWEQLLAFVQEREALNAGEVAAYRARIWQALKGAAQEQLAHRDEVNLVARFLKLLGAALASGRAHVTGRDGGQPDHPAV